MIIRKIIILFSVLTFFLFLVLVIIGWYWGVFATVNVEQRYIETKYFYSSNRIIPYNLIHVQRDSLNSTDSDDVLFCPAEVAILFNDPFYKKPSEIRVISGCIKDSTYRVDSENLTSIRLDSGKYVVGLIQAHVQVAPYRIYPAINEWIANHEYEPDASRYIIERYSQTNSFEVWYPIQSVKLFE